jgi:signal transduction histidine kinase
MIELTRPTATRAADRAAHRAVARATAPRAVPLGGRMALVLAVGLVGTVAAQLPAVFTEPFFVGVNVLVVLSFVGLGYYLADQHGERFTGCCVVLAGVGWVVVGLDVHPQWGAPASFLVGGPLIGVALGWGVLRFGRVRLDAPARWWVAVAVVVTVGSTAAVTAVSRPQWLGYDPAAVWPAPWADRTAATVAVAVALVAWLATGALFARVVLARLAQAPPAERRILRPMALACAGWGGVAAVVAVVGGLAPGLLPLHGAFVVVGLMWVKVTVALAATVNRSRLLATIFVETLPSERTPEALTAYVRSALSDPTAELLFAVPDRPLLIDGSGRLRDHPDPDDRQRFAQWIVGSGGARVAVLTGDPVLRADLTAVRSFAKVLSIVAENQQLHAVLRMRLAQLAAVRAAERLAVERARAQFRRDLHDGLQQTIAAARMDLDGVREEVERTGGGHPAAAAVADVEAKLQLAVSQIRGLEHGTAPPELSAGLGCAVERTVAELRLTATCRITADDLGALTLPVYYLVREALTNVHKHARTASVQVFVQQTDGFVEVVVRDGGAGGATARPGGGLAGLRDRVAELGGRLEVTSPPGAGTVLHAVIPAVPA